MFIAIILEIQYLKATKYSVKGCSYEIVKNHSNRFSRFS